VNDRSGSGGNAARDVPAPSSIVPENLDDRSVHLRADQRGIGSREGGSRSDEGCPEVTEPVVVKGTVDSAPFVAVA